MKNIEIMAYQPEHQPYFERFNRDWIEQYFWLEDIDRFVLQHPQEAILDKGGAILMASFEGSIAGTVALRKVDEGIYEFTKMAVDPPFRRKGIAEALSYAALQKAAELGAWKVILYSQTGLAAAIAMYRKIGFVEVPIEEGVYARSDIKMEILLKQDGNGKEPG
ncbi:MAG TPA: GNAT family N-acetyltransferase [Flavisolibacter sp.]|nr:GNAT family N-acetyltransferase [Flavisolibacter sp.]